MAPRKSCRRKKELSLTEKLAVVSYAENHSERNTATLFGISKTAVNYIKKNKHVFQALREVNEEVDSNRCRRIRYTPNLDINNQTLEWVQRMLKNGEPITAKLIKEKALSYAHDAGVLNFSASNGWLESFKRRFGIELPSAKSMCSAHVNQTNPTAESSQTSQVAKTTAVIREVWKRVLPSQAKEVNTNRNKGKNHGNCPKGVVDNKRRRSSSGNKIMEMFRRQRHIDLLF